MGVSSVCSDVIPGLACGWAVCRCRTCASVGGGSTTCGFLPSYTSGIIKKGVYSSEHCSFAGV